MGAAPRSGSRGWNPLRATLGRVSERAPRSELKNIGYEIFIGILSVLSIVNLVLLRSPTTRTSRASCAP